MAGRYTQKQGQYLAFIYYYTKIHDMAPAESEMQRYFGVTPPSVHQMILGLEERGLITRTTGTARSIRFTLPHNRPSDSNYELRGARLGRPAI